MAHELVATAIILKKQAFDEADELLTFFSKEQGKLRALAKSSKLPKSKLSYALHQASLVEITLAGKSKLAKLIRVHTLNLFPFMRENPEAISAWYVASELVLKATPDEQKNKALFELLQSFLEFLNQSKETSVIRIGLHKFKIHLLQNIGLGLWFPEDRTAIPKFFSNTTGGFVMGNTAVDSVPVNRSAWELFGTLREIPWVAVQSIAEQSAELGGLLSGFIEYQLEREIKSEKFLSMSVPNKSVIY